jgi:hypothetical protein
MVKTGVLEWAIGADIAPATADSIGLGQALLWVAVALTVDSGAQYLLSGRAAATAMDR